MINNFKRGLLAIIASALLVAVPSFADTTLDANTDYTVVIYEYGSEGKVELSSKTETSDSNGYLEYEFSGVSSCEDGVYFYKVDIEDSNGDVVLSSIAPAPNPDETVEIGASDLSSSVALAIDTLFDESGEVDQLTAAYAMNLTRSPDLSDEDITAIATATQLIIGDEDGMTDYMAAKAGESVYTAFEKELVCSSDEDGYALNDYTEGFKDANHGRRYDGDTDEEAFAQQIEAGDKLASILIDAAIRAGMETPLLIAGLEYADDIADDRMQDAEVHMSEDASAIVGVSLDALRMRLEAEAEHYKRYHAMKNMGATDEELAMLEDAHANMEFTNHHEFYHDPDGYMDDHGYSDVGEFTDDIALEMETEKDEYEAHFEDPFSDSNMSDMIDSLELMMSIAGVEVDLSVKFDGLDYFQIYGIMHMMKEGHDFEYEEDDTYSSDGDYDDHTDFSSGPLAWIDDLLYMAEDAAYMEEDDSFDRSNSDYDHEYEAKEAEWEEYDDRKSSMTCDTCDDDEMDWMADLFF